MSPKRKPTQAVDIYVRVSQVAGRVGESFQSPAEQEKRCRALLESRGLEVGEVFIDLDQSGGKMSRPQFNKVMSRIRKGESGGIAVAYLSRFARNLRGLLDGVKEIEELGAVFVCADINVDTSTPNGRLMLQLFGALDEFTREQRRESWKTSRSNAVARGVHGGPLVPAGYDRLDDRLVPNADADAIRHAFEMKAAKATAKEIAAYLTAAGATIRQYVPDPEDTTYQAEDRKQRYHLVEHTDWLPSSVASVLGNRTYLGEARSGEYVNPDAHEAIIPQWLWRKAQGGVAPTERRSSRGHDTPLLRGLLFCASCGAPMTSDRRVYRCAKRARGHVCETRAKIQRSRIEEYVLELASVEAERREQERVASGAADTAEVNTKVLEHALAQAHADLAELEAAEADMSPVAYGKAYDKALTALDQAQVALDEATAQDTRPFAEIVAEREGPAADKRMVTSVVSRIIVKSGDGTNRWTPVAERVTVEFA